MAITTAMASTVNAVWRVSARPVLVLVDGCVTTGTARDDLVSNVAWGAPRTRVYNEIDLSFATGRILALDLGKRRIGLALSDPLGITAQGLPNIVRTNKRSDLAVL